LQNPGTGKGVSLACFLVSLFMFTLFVPDCLAQQVGGVSYPVINRLDRSDVRFVQFIDDVHANRRRIVGLRANLQEAAENLTIFQYTVRQGEDIQFLAARSNIPISALVTLNRLNNPSALRTGMLILLPSCPGIFIPADSESDLEMIIGASRQNSENSIELRISKQGRPLTFRFIPGADFTPTELGYFLNLGFRFPLRSYRITSSYGMRNDPFTGHTSMHHGIDLAAPEGTEVFAVADGVVTSMGYDPVLGNYIIITHNNNLTSLYGHLQRFETVLRSEVKSGTLIGRVGTTGRSTGPHLHFELRQNGRHFDPSGRLRL
jgi:murein DD-endopeptidase MepM/ murein hydrolase activator NlpD